MTPIDALAVLESLHHEGDRLRLPNVTQALDVLRRAIAAMPTADALNVPAYDGCPFWPPEAPPSKKASALTSFVQADRTAQAGQAFAAAFRRRMKELDEPWPKNTPSSFEGWAE